MTKTIPLNQAKFVLVDAEDYEDLVKWNWTYNIHGGGYASRTDRSGEKQKTILMHRYILGAKPGDKVDHVNRNRLDNRRENLRICTSLENARNSSKRKDGKTSEFKGVNFKNSNGKYSSSIQVDGRRIFLGYYDCRMNAAYYYNQAAITHFGEYAVLNDLPSEFAPTVEFAPSKARGNYSNYRGVTFSKRDNKYLAKIQHDKKTINIGMFLTERMAAEMYNVYAVELHGDRAVLNQFD